MDLHHAVTVVVVVACIAIKVVVLVQLCGLMVDKGGTMVVVVVRNCHLCGYFGGLMPSVMVDKGGAMTMVVALQLSELMGRPAISRGPS